MKYILLFICVLGAFSSFLPNKKVGSSVALPSKQNLIDFVIGNLIALKVTEVVPDGFGCVNTLQNLQNATQQAWALIETKEVENIIRAAELIEDALNQTKQVCGSASDEGRAGFEAFINNIKDPNFISLAMANIRNNFFTILQDFQKGISDLNNQSFFNAGYDFGSIFHLIINNGSELLNLVTTEINNLGSVNWPFTNCASGSPISPSAVNLDSQPSKGAAEGVNVLGTVNGAVTLKQVQIVTLLNGTPLNTQYDPNTSSYQQGDAFNYRFSITIPGFAPSGAYSVSMTFQAADGSTQGCINVAFNL
jgi:hypothetical protein